MKITDIGTKRVVIYARVSTDEQTAENQTQALETWAARRGFEVVEIYQENETAWKAGHQKELKRLLDGAYKRKFEAVLVWSLDRLSREGALAILSLVNKLQQFGVSVYSYQESWTEAPGQLGEVLYSLTGWVARMESERRSERTKAGMSRAGAAGQHLGRPKGSADKTPRKRRSTK